jgi:molecular chaperone DnaK
MAELNAAWTAASQDIYNTQQAQGGGQQSAGGSQQSTGGGQQSSAGQGSGAEDVTDVPYEEVK